MAKFVTGSLFVFNVYENDVKEIFNYTQSEGIKFILSEVKIIKH